MFLVDIGLTFLIQYYNQRFFRFSEYSVQF